MSQKFEKELSISRNINNILSRCVSSAMIDNFHMENQFQFNVIVIYILGDKHGLVEFHNYFKEILIEETQDFSVDINILYNYQFEGIMFDMEFMQGKNEIMRGYAIEEFGYYSEVSDSIDTDFYTAMARSRQDGK